MHQGWMFSIQLKYVASQLRGTNAVRPSRTAAIAGCASVVRVDIPLLREERLDDDPGAIAMRHHVRVRLGLGEQAGRLHARDDLLAHDEAVEAMIGQRFLERR